ncbi:hypothetical protein HYDPIDRAFT_33989 [Hydnomerulius pinastri MD-312]|uniref:Uncharacterized protein n=1 Tax=Hydnomerulius pinastri MD-312 TaxID=994086 RepID=A0A0C9V092_9AGAM|nr:hypothetical protein HYDPIDRAFT_33989 [Hydnomerulius pinastri MD-312]
MKIDSPFLFQAMDPSPQWHSGHPTWPQSEAYTNTYYTPDDAFQLPEYAAPAGSIMHANTYFFHRLTDTQYRNVFPSDQPDVIVTPTIWDVHQPQISLPLQSHTSHFQQGVSSQEYDPRFHLPVQPLPQQQEPPPQAPVPSDDHEAVLNFMRKHPNEFSTRLRGLGVPWWGDLGDEVWGEAWSEHILKGPQNSRLFETVSVMINGESYDTLIGNERFLTKMVQKVIDTLLITLCNHILGITHNIVSRVLGPISDYTIAEGQRHTQWLGQRGYAFWHQSTNDTDFCGPLMVQVVHEALCSPPSDPSFAGVFQKVPSPSGRSHFCHVQYCTPNVWSFVSAFFVTYVDAVYKKTPNYTGNMTSTLTTKMLESH